MRGYRKPTIEIWQGGEFLLYGEEIEIPASKVPAFKPGKALKDAIK